MPPLPTETYWVGINYTSFWVNMLIRLNVDKVYSLTHNTSPTNIFTILSNRNSTLGGPWKNFISNQGYLDDQKRGGGQGYFAVRGNDQITSGASLKFYESIRGKSGVFFSSFASDFMLCLFIYLKHTYSIFLQLGPHPNGHTTSWSDLLIKTKV